MQLLARWVGGILKMHRLWIEKNDAAAVALKSERVTESKEERDVQQHTGVIISSV